AGLGRTVLVGLPPLGLLAALADIAAGPLLLLLAQAAILTFTVAAACLLLSIWARRTGDAILGSYAAALVLYLVIRAFSNALPLWLDPFKVIEDWSAARNEGLSSVALVGHLAAWACAGALCLVLA